MWDLLKLLLDLLLDLFDWAFWQDVNRRHWRLGLSILAGLTFAGIALRFIKVEPYRDFSAGVLLAVTVGFGALWEWGVER